MTAQSNRSVFPLLISIIALFGCSGSDSSGPPDVRVGQAICKECGMMLSDERFVFATMIQGDRGREPLVFDDSICQHNYETQHTDLVILERWARDYVSHDWIPESTAYCVRSDQIKTPMAAHVAFFATKADAESLAKELGSEVIGFKELWSSGAE